MNLNNLNILLLLLGIPICWLATTWLPTTGRIGRYPWRKKIWLTMIALALIALGLVSETVSFQKINDSFDRRSWHKTIGTVIRSSVVGERAYRPNIVYQIESNGEIHIDSTDLNPASFGGRNARLKSAEKLASEFGPGDSVIVWVNPENPTETSLSIHVFWAEYMKTSFGYGLYLVGLVLLLTTIRTFANPRN